MQIGCPHKIAQGAQFCISDHPVNVPCGAFKYQRIENPSQVPPPDERIIDVAILDMNHGWANLGHDCIVHLIQDVACDTLGLLDANHLSLRALSFDVRRSGVVPEANSNRFPLYVGTGGPGHINPWKNDGHSEQSQGVREDASWEPGMFDLFNYIHNNDRTALLAVCHTFGVMCRWSGIAEPIYRGPEKGGKSTGVLENVLTPQAEKHPWFHRFSEKLPNGRLRILDSRLYDLIPPKSFTNGVIPLGYETLTPGGPPGDALTMIEWARDKEGVMPRILGVNHHPEIVNRDRQLLILNRKYENGEVSKAWYDERLEILTGRYPGENSEALLALTSDYTFIAPLRFHLFRSIRLRSEALGHPVPLHENQILQ